MIGAQEVTNLDCHLLTDEARRWIHPGWSYAVKRSKSYNLLKNAGVFLNIVGVAAIPAVCSLVNRYNFHVLGRQIASYLALHSRA